jgi:RNA polymerase sigma-70 factor (ECF subfamily)
MSPESLAGGRPLDDEAARTTGHDDEPELIERARRGDHDAYETLVRRYQDLAFRTAYVVVRDADEAEDAAQEGFVKAYFALSRFRAGAPFRPWLLQIVVNEARNRRTAAARRTNLALRVASADAAAAGPDSGPPGRYGPSSDAAPSPEAAALARERAAELLAAVNALREEDRAVIACRYFLDLSEAETAEVLDLPRGTVKSRLSRALGRVRTLLTTPVESGGRTADG